MFSKTTRFEFLLEAVPDAEVGMDQTGVIRCINRQTKSRFGYNRDNLIGLPIDTLTPELPRQIYASHPDFAGRPASIGLDLERSRRHRARTELMANIGLSHIDTGNVALDHGGA